MDSLGVKGDELKNISIVIPVARGGSFLVKTLKGIRNQKILPKEVILVEVKKINPKILHRFSSYFKIKTVKGGKNSSLASLLNLGVKEARGEIIFFTDDDAIPYRDWVSSILKEYEKNPKIGACGGRDILFDGKKVTKPKVVKWVGKLSWYGRIIGNHHQTTLSGMEVDFLKGVNMSFKRKLLHNLDPNLTGIYRTEQEWCFLVKKKGYLVWFTPYAKVLHWKKENILTSKVFWGVNFNTTYLLLKYLPFWKKVIFLVFTFIIGQRGTPGLVKGIMMLPSVKFKVDLIFTSFRAKITAIRTKLKTKSR